ncbi:MAG: ABC-type transport auxiliary lipoprotein family protein [Gammaproteobacteria bacterium]
MSARLRTHVALLSALLLSGCAVLPGPNLAVINKYVLEYNTTASATATGDEGELPVMIVSVPRAIGGYDTSRIAYREQQYDLRYYSKSRWADTPAQMLAPLITEAINATGEFRTIYASPGASAAGYRLDSELIHFYQDFTVQPSQMRITLRAQLINLVENKVLASRLFDLRQAATSEDAYGGVQAANRATGRLLNELVQFCKTRTDR